MELLLGNKNYSSWSMRAGVVAAAFDLPVTTATIWIDAPDALATKLEHSPAGRVPILVVDGVTVWDSLAICELFAERFPDRGLWPEDPLDRAQARSLAAEMHSGFFAIREQLPLNVRARKPAREWPEEVRTEIHRMTQIFREARGPYLFGAGFTIADAFFAPVASRFVTYGVTLPEDAARYAAALLDHPAVRDWIAAADSEGRQMPQYDDA